MKFTTLLSSFFFVAASLSVPQSENALKKRTGPVITSDGQAGAVVYPDSGKFFTSISGSRYFVVISSAPKSFFSIAVAISQMFFPKEPLSDSKVHSS